MNVLWVERPELSAAVPSHKLWHFLPKELEAPPNNPQRLILPVEILLVLNLRSGSRTGIELRLGSETGRSPRTELPSLLRFALG